MVPLAIVSFFTLLALGSDRVAILANRVLNYLTEAIAPSDSVRHLRPRMVGFLFLAGLLFGVFGVRELAKPWQLTIQSAIKAFDHAKAVLQETHT